MASFSHSQECENDERRSHGHGRGSLGPRPASWCGGSVALWDGAAHSHILKNVRMTSGGARGARAREPGAAARLLVRRLCRSLGRRGSFSHSRECENDQRRGQGRAGEGARGGGPPLGAEAMRLSGKGSHSQILKNVRMTQGRGDRDAPARAPGGPRQATAMSASGHAPWVAGKGRRSHARGDMAAMTGGRRGTRGHRGGWRWCHAQVCV